jgi:hypothetical protein
MFEIVDDVLQLDSFFREGETPWVKPKRHKKMMVDSAQYREILTARFPNCTENRLKRVVQYLSEYVLRTAECLQVERESPRKRFNPDAKQKHY